MITDFANCEKLEEEKLEEEKLKIQKLTLKKNKKDNWAKLRNIFFTKSKLNKFNFRNRHNKKKNRNKSKWGKLRNKLFGSDSKLNAKNNDGISINNKQKKSIKISFGFLEKLKNSNKNKNIMKLSNFIKII